LQIIHGEQNEYDFFFFFFFFSLSRLNTQVFSVKRGFFECSRVVLWLVHLFSKRFIKVLSVVEDEETHYQAQAGRDW
jgi:hypothetical protein